jgi:hypothetical protein
MGAPYGVSERSAQGVSVSLTRQPWFRGLTIVVIVAAIGLRRGHSLPFVAGMAPACLLVIATPVVAFDLI